MFYKKFMVPCCRVICIVKCHLISWALSFVDFMGTAFPWHEMQTTTKYTIYIMIQCTLNHYPQNYNISTCNT